MDRIYGPFLSRRQAKACGATYYFTGKPCKHGHIALRQTSKGVCEECHRLHRTSAHAHARTRAWYAERMKDPEFRAAKCRESRKHYHEVMKHDPEKMARRYAQIAEYAKNNRETVNRAGRAHRKRNPGYDRPYVVARRANIKHSELTEAQQLQVKAIYELRKKLTEVTGIEHHVDHHQPLSKGGTHEPSNLWVIPWNENLSKGARWIEAA